MNKSLPIVPRTPPLLTSLMLSLQTFRLKIITFPAESCGDELIIKAENNTNPDLVVNPRLNMKNKAGSRGEGALLSCLRAKTRSLCSAPVPSLFCARPSDQIVCADNSADRLVARSDWSHGRGTDYSRVVICCQTLGRRTRTAYKCIPDLHDDPERSNALLRRLKLAAWGTLDRS